MDFDAIFDATIWLWKGDGSWHFVDVPLDVADQARLLMAHKKAGFGSIPVVVEIGESRWRTSMFPQKTTGSFVLPIKAQVRKENGLSASDKAHIRLIFEA